ncbi:MAG: MFS transporter [Candidatus Lokiarchaeota archaeon]|nr:MFS transporter [Candidatus Lokiarchaeota archaeon]
MLKDDNKYYFPLLIIFLCFNDIFDSYATNYPNSIGSFIELEFVVSHSIFLIAVGIASIGTYFVFLNQYLSDLFGRRILLFAILIGIGVSSFIISISQNIIQYTIGLFLLYVFFSSDIWTIYLSEQASEKHRGKYISLILVFGAVGGALTVPLFRTFLIPNFGWRSMTWFAFLAIPIAFCTFIFKESKVYRDLKRDKRKGPSIFNLDNFRKIFGMKMIKSTLTVSFLGFFIGFNYVFLLSGEPYLVDRGLDASGIDLIITMIAIGAIIGYILAGVISDYMGRKPVIYIFCMLGTPGILMVILGNYFIITIGAFIVSIAYWALFVTSRQIAIEIYSTDIRGAGAGFRSLLFAIGTTIGAFWTSFLLQFIGLGWSFFVNSIFLILMIPFVYFFIKETKGIKLDFTQFLGKEAHSFRCGRKCRLF